MTLLDTILGDMETGAKVVSQEHDPNAINWVAGLSDPGEMIRCGYLPQIRRHPGEQDAEYQARITPIVLTLPQKDKDRIMGVAQRRASLDTSNGRVNAFFAGKPAWHGLGVVVDKAATSAEAIALAGLDWKVEKVRYSYDFGGKWKESPDAFAIVRADTGDHLGTVGSRYTPVQNSDGFAFLDGVLGEYGAKYETAGSIYGGRRVWMLAHMPEQRFAVQDGDEIEPYVMFSNCHDGSGAAWAFPTSVRTECANTFRIAMNSRGSKALSIRHTGAVSDKMQAAREALGLAVESFAEYRTAAEQMVKTPCPVEPQVYFGSVLDQVIQFTEAEQALHSGNILESMLLRDEAARELAQKTLERKLARRGEIMEDMLQRYESERCHPRGSVWAALNAVTEHADHGNGRRQIGTQDAKLSRRFESILTGEADAMKQEAYQQASAMLAV